MNTPLNSVIAIAHLSLDVLHRAQRALESRITTAEGVKINAKSRKAPIMLALMDQALEDDRNALAHIQAHIAARTHGELAARGGSGVTAAVRDYVARDFNEPTRQPVVPHETQVLAGLAIGGVKEDGGDNLTASEQNALLEAGAQPVRSALQDTLIGQVVGA